MAESATTISEQDAELQADLTDDAADLSAQITADQSLAAAAQTILSTQQQASDQAQKKLDQALDAADEQFAEEGEQAIDKAADADEASEEKAATAIQTANTVSVAAATDTEDEELTDEQQVFQEKSLDGNIESVSEDALGESLIEKVATANRTQADQVATNRNATVTKVAPDDAKIGVDAATQMGDDQVQEAQDDVAAANALNTTKDGPDWNSLLVIGQKQVLPPSAWDQLQISIGKNLSNALDHATNVSTGMADALTFGATREARQGMGMDFVDYDSWGYKGGEIAGTVTSFVLGGGAGAACNAGRVALIVQGYASVSTAVGMSQAISSYMNTGTISLTQAAAFIPAVGWAAGRIGVAAKLWNGCFVINTPVAVGWQYDPLYVGQSTPQSSGLPAVDAEAGDWNAGWIIAGLGIVATTVLVRDRRETDRNEKKKRRLYFANGQFIEDFADDLPDEIPNDTDSSRHSPCAVSNKDSSRQSPSAVPSTQSVPPPLPSLKSLAPSSPASDNSEQEPHSMSSITPVTRNKSDERRESTNRATPRRRSPLAKLFWSLPFLLAGVCFWRGLPSAERPAASAAAMAATTASPIHGEAVAPRRTLITRPIQEIQVGQRVLANNPQLAGQDVPQADITEESHRLVTLRMVKPDGSDLMIQTLKPFDELAVIALARLTSEAAEPIRRLPLVGSPENVFLYEALVGSTLELHMAELGIEGPAKIVGVHACPEIEADDGTARRLVTSVFHHAAANVVDVATTGSDEPIGATANHPFWSEDRQAFIPAGDLRPGESLRKADGTHVQVASITPRTGSAMPVFNFEVDGQHVYSVGADGLLVHNNCEEFAARLLAKIPNGVRFHIFPNRTPFTGPLPGYPLVRGGKTSFTDHFIHLENGVLRDPANPAGIPIETWLAQFATLNNMKVSQVLDFLRFTPKF